MRALALLVALAAALPAFGKGSPAAGPSVSPSPRPVTEFRDEIERDFVLRTIGQLQVTNMRGDIVIQGWSLDKIRIKARRRAMAADETEAKRLFSAVDFRYKEVDGFIELGAEYGRGLSLEERLQERSKPRTAMEMTVFAPANLKLRVWGVDGRITVRGWSASVDARAASGTINIDGVKSGGASVLCPACEIRLKDVRGPVRCMGGSGPISVSGVEAPHTYVEASTGSISAARVKGEQLYVTKEGPLSGKDLRGHIEFHSQGAPVEIVDGAGFLSGRTLGGNITARMREWEFADKAVIESVQGNIRLSLPSDFSGDVDLFSVHGQAEIAFPVDRAGDRPNTPLSGAAQAPVPASGRRITGRVGEGGELLKVFSNRGNIQVVRGG